MARSVALIFLSAGTIGLALLTFFVRRFELQFGLLCLAIGSGVLILIAVVDLGARLHYYARHTRTRAE